uniref:Putative c-type lectin n=1 Tax=Culex tarsalis TaxID=7177 RepID=A0A1Q3FQP2_CULTA
MIMVKNLAALCGLVLLTVVGTNPGGGVQARAVNISNTWTLPQDGFTVFYRYFRDKISWFEADAVCQFHHANLVTVDNGVQFDAARAFLKELDVTNPVWIGLMRPENSARFTWTNAKTLDPASGYWAESLPAMETPLCAVVDPVRDFRWHALRCGGPETAAFLCELPVPTWATDCTITSMPSLTVQYMSDSGAVQLSRDCGEQGTKHMSCQGKLDRDTILQQLQCSEQEEDPALAQIAATENNQLPLEDTAKDQQQKVLSARIPTPPQILEHDILTVVSNNDEDNNIDVNPNQIEDTVKNVINKFNLADLMQNDQSLHSDEAEVRFGEQEKEGKKTTGGKKYSPLFEKKDKYGRKSDKKVDDDEELMMGDQPDETETQPIDIVQQAVKPTEGDSDESSTIGAAGSSSTDSEPATTSEAAQTESTTLDSRLRRATDSETSSESAITATTELSTTEPSTTTTQEPTTSSTASSHILPTTPKKEIASVGDHFIPPMLLVKARFTSTKSHDHETTTTEAVESTSETSEATQSSSSLAPEQTSTTLHEETSSASENDVHLNDKPSTEVPSVTEVASSTTGHQIVEITFDDHELSSKIGTLSITTRPFISAEQTTVTPEATTAVATTSGHNATTPQEVSSSTTQATVTTTTVVVPSSTATPTTTSSSTTTTTPPAPTIAPTTSASHVEPFSSEEHGDHENEANDGDENGSDEHEHQHHSGEHNKFSNIENYQPYKPNRHRALSKSEMHNNRNNYIKKILG